MPIDIVKKNKNPQRTVNLKKRQSLNQKNTKISAKGGRKQKDKKSLEEKLEKKFAHLPAVAQHQKIKIMWATVIFLTGIIVIIWFYLVGRGVLLRLPLAEEKGDDFAKLTEDITTGFNEIKEQLSSKKGLIKSLKSQLELVITKNELIDNLKENLEKQLNENNEDSKEVDKTISQSGNLIVTYPLPNNYIDNPVRILGRGQFFEGEFKVRLKDNEDKILGQTSGMNEESGVMSTFEVELNYSNPDTETGILELYTLSAKDGSEQDLVLIPVKFIIGLQDWQVYRNGEWGIEFKYPENLAYRKIVDDNKLSYLEFDNQEVIEKIEKNISTTDENYIIVRYYRNLDQFNIDGEENHNKSLQSFVTNLKESKEININGWSFYYLLSDNGLAEYFSKKESGEIFNISSRAENSLTTPILNQILSTFNFIEPDYKNWNEYQDIGEEVSFKYPKELIISDDLGQITFRAEDPDGFSFHLFTIEPQIDNLQKWVEESSVNVEEKIVKSENQSFGDAVDAVYYESVVIEEQGSDEDEEATKKAESYNFIFNHYGATYSFRTNKDNFPNTFKNILNTIKFKTPPLETPEEEALKQEFLEKYQ